METKYFVDTNGVFLGGFGGRMIDGDPTPDTDPVEYEQVECCALPPDGAIQITEPPAHGFDVLENFKVSDGAAVGGTWNTSNRPVEITPEQRIINAMVKAGVMTEKQAVTVMGELQK